MLVRQADGQSGVMGGRVFAERPKRIATTNGLELMVMDVVSFSSDDECVVSDHVPFFDVVRFESDSPSEEEDESFSEGWSPLR